MNRNLIKNLISEILFGSRICESLEDRYFSNVVYETINGDLLMEKLLVGEPVSVPELRKILRKRILNFEFIKLDGEIRPARGTTMMKYIPQSDHPKGIRPSSPKVATFFDLDKKAWRSVSNRSKEVVLKYGFGEKKKPVFVVKDKDAPMPDTEKEPIKKTQEFEPELDPSVDVDKIEVVDVDDVDDTDIFGDIDLDTPDMVRKDDIEDVTPVSKPNVEVIPKYGWKPKPKYGWKPKQVDKPKEDLPPAGEIEDVIVKPNIGWKPKVYDEPKKEIKILLPQPVGKPLRPIPEPSPTKDLLKKPGPKPPPLIINPEEDIF